MTALSRGLRTAPPFPSARSYMPPTSKPCTPPQKEAPAGRVGEGRTPGRRWTACLWADVGMATASAASAAPVAERPDSFQAPGSTRFSAARSCAGSLSRCPAFGFGLPAGLCWSLVVAAGGTLGRSTAKAAALTCACPPQVYCRLMCRGQQGFHGMQGCQRRPKSVCTTGAGRHSVRQRYLEQSGLSLPEGAQQICCLSGQELESIPRVPQGAVGLGGMCRPSLNFCVPDMFPRTFLCRSRQRLALRGATASRWVLCCVRLMSEATEMGQWAQSSRARCVCVFVCRQESTDSINLLHSFNITDPPGSVTSLAL